MRIASVKVYSLTAFIILALASASFGQVVSSMSSNDTRPAQVDAAQAATNKVLSDAGLAFNEGLQAYTANDRSTAGEKFNRAVEVFLYSTLNIQKDQKLQGCYNQLIETIYRI